MKKIKGKLSAIVGREKELRELSMLYRAPTAKLAVLYGRRRVGKTFLIEHFGADKNYLYFDGLEDEPTSKQLQQVSEQLFLQTNNQLLRSFDPKTWGKFFATLLEVIPSNKKTVIVFDEIQWMACGQSRLISIFKSYWDQYFQHKNVLIVLCGSIAHYMVKKIIRSKALYGRIDSEMLIRELEPEDARTMLPRRGDLEALKYQIILGGIPKYLKEVNQTLSFEDNISNLFFKDQTFFFKEIDKIFFSQFREAETYKKIIYELSKENLNLEQIAKKLHVKSGGSLKEVLYNLELASFIKSYKPLAIKRSKEMKYKLVDSYIRFYYQYLRSYEKIISEGKGAKLFAEQIKSQWQPWLGLAFEVFVFRNALWLADKLGFLAKVKEYGPYLLNSNGNKAQIDLAFIRSDNVITLVEVKFQKKVDTSIIQEMERKIIILQEKIGTLVTIEKVLVTPFEVDKKLIHTEYFHTIIGIKELFKRSNSRNI